MKNFKKFLTGALAAVMVIGSVMTVNANPSMNTDMELPDEYDGYYVILPIEEENFRGYEKDGVEIDYTELVGVIDTFNRFDPAAYETEEELDAALEEAMTTLLSDETENTSKGEAVLKKIKSLDLVPFTAIFDVKPVGDAVNNEIHRFEIFMPNLTKQMKNIRFLHFCLENSEWELLKPKKIDYTNQLITLETDTLSPLMGMYSEKATSSGGSNSGQSSTTQTPVVEGEVPTSPKTDNVSTNWMLWMAAAVALAAAGTVVVSKKAQNNFDL